MNNDTVRLLRECDAGIKMGISAIDDVLNYVHDGIMRQILIESMEKHEDYADKIKEMLDTVMMREKILILWQKVCRGLRQM